MKAKHDRSLNYFCSWMSFKNKCTTHFNWIRMSPDRTRSPCFASKLGFSSICAILWVTSGFTDLKKHCGCWCRTKRECHWKSLKAALHLCAYLLSLLNLFFKVESEIPSIFSYLELKQCNQNIIYTIFVFIIWQVRRSPETECFFQAVQSWSLHCYTLQTERQQTLQAACLDPTLFYLSAPITHMRGESWTVAPWSNNMCNTFNTKQTTFGLKVFYI